MRDDVPIKITFPEELSGLFHKYHDRILVDSSLSDKDVILLSIYLIEQKNQKAGVSRTKCRKLFSDLGRTVDPNFRVNLNNARKESLVKQEGSVLYFLSDGLNRVSKILGQVEKAPVYVIKSGENFTAIKKLEEFFAREIDSKELLLCDPYISHSTLFPLTVLKGRVSSVKMLTSNIEDNDKFKNYLAKMKKEFEMSVEVKLSKKIHDRYMICGDKCWAFGTSIKDLGNKDTIIREISEVTTSMKELFSGRWIEPSS